MKSGTLTRSLQQRPIAMFWVLLVLSAAAAGAEKEKPEKEDLTNLDLATLMQVDVKITSVSKKETRLSDSPAAITVITQDDIRRSGITQIPELLRQVPGMEVAHYDANKWAIGTRGFNFLFQRKLLVLMDGRTLYSPQSSSVYWTPVDYLIEDLERIEAIRGPGAALWGANAVNGVVNITTKSARDTQGTLLSTSLGDIERVAGLRYGGKLDGNTYFRAYGQYRGTDDYRLANSTSAGDAWHAMRGGVRADRYQGADTFTFETEAYRTRSTERTELVIPTVPFIDVEPREANFDGGFVLGRWTRTLAPESNLSVQLYYDVLQKSDTWIDYTQQIADLDVQHAFPLSPRQSIVWGGGFRYQPDRNTSRTEPYFYSPQRSYHHIANVFFQDDIAVIAERLHAIVGSKFEYTTQTGWELQPSVRGLWTPDAKNTVWGAVSRAVRTPSRFEEDTTLIFSRFDLGGGMPADISYHGDSDLETERLTSYELGYRTQLTPRLYLDLACGYDRHEGLITSGSAGAPFFDVSPPPRLIIPLVAANNMSARARSVELAAQWNVIPQWQLSGSYTWTRIETHGGGDIEASFYRDGTPAQQFQLHSFHRLTQDLDFDTSLYYVDHLKLADIPSYVRLDLTVLWRLKSIELRAGAQNILERRHEEFSSGGIVPTHTSEVPRSVFVGLNWRT